jgi:mRNA-degrading endonuclease toxin of MazEF toxin-antitoxin module
VRRGEVWRYRPVLERPGQSTARLIVSAEGINQLDELPVVLGLNILATDPGTLISVRVDPWGWASALAIEAVMRRRLVERLDIVAPDVMDQVDAALRAALEL